MLGLDQNFFIVTCHSKMDLSLINKTIVLIHSAQMTADKSLKCLNEVKEKDISNKKFSQWNRTELTELICD